MSGQPFKAPMEDLSLASPSPSSLNPSNPTPAPASIGAEGRNSDVESVSTAEATAVTNNSETTHGSTEQPNTTATHDTETPSSSSIDSASTPLSTSNVILPVSAETLRNVTSKERFNFASGSCAASVIAANVEASGTSAILNENKDSYMLNKCLSREKFVVVELCDDVLVEVFALANFEILSSTVKDFTVYVSQQSNDGWKLLGRFRANNTREVQAFRVPAKVWGRYIRIEFVSHYGREVFCPLSLLRIHGRTMMDELKEEDSKRTDAPVENEALEEVEELLLGGTARPGSESHVRLPRRARDAELLRWNEPLDYGPLDMAETDVQLVRLFQRYFTAKSAASSESDSNGSSQQEASSSEDSVFRSMLKRLSLVERNVTASSKYLQDEVQIVHHYFNLLFAKVNNVSRTLQREIHERRNPDRLLLRTYAAANARIEVPDELLRHKLALLEQNVNRISSQLVLCQILLFLLCLGLLIGGFLTLVPRRKIPKKTLAFGQSGNVPPTIKKKQ